MNDLKHLTSPIFLLSIGTYCTVTYGAEYCVVTGNPVPVGFVIFSRILIYFSDPEL